MVENELKVMVTAELDKPKFITQINNDIMRIETQLKMLKLQAYLSGKENNYD